MKSPFILITLLLSISSWSQVATQVVFHSEDIEYVYEKEYIDTLTIFDYQEFEYDYIKIPDFTNVSAIKKTENVTKNDLINFSKSPIEKSISTDQYTDNTPIKKVDTKPVLEKYSVHKMDSLWKKELYSSNLYNDIYDEVKNYDSKSGNYKKLDTETLITRLKALDEKTPFNIEYNPILENVIKKYLKNRGYALAKIINKSYYYFPLFEKELSNFDIPMEIKYLAVVESALMPRAKSHVGATGLWQFMYETGKMHDLKVNSYVDERMDPIKATKAACTYLKRLHNTFNDWDLALAAYNSGPGNVLKAIRRSGGKRNYWNIRQHLPKETAGYLPAFLATMYLFEYANEHDLRRTTPKHLYFESDTVRIKRKVRFDEIAKAIDIDMEELKFLNPSYKLNIIPKSTANPYSLKLPINKVADFIEYEQKLYGFASSRENKKEKSLYHHYSTTNKFTYTVRGGDYLGKIAGRFNTSVGLIKRWNNLRTSKIKIGQKLTIFRKKDKSTEVVYN